MDAQTLLLEALDARWEQYREKIKICRGEYSEESVHDLRVAARRLLALTDLIRAVAPHPRLQKIRRALKRQLDEFDELRDTQVMLVEIAQKLEELPALLPFQEALQKRERRLLREAEYLIEALKLGGLAMRLGKVRASLTEQPASLKLDERVLQAVDDAYLTVMQRYGWIDPAQPASIHRTRIAFKKFRYMVEVIQPLLPELPEDHFKHMRAYQAAMGNIQDAEVFLHNLAEFAEKETDYDPQPVLRYYNMRHAEMVAAFCAGRQELLFFWRPAGQTDFPWQAESPAPANLTG